MWASSSTRPWHPARCAAFRLPAGCLSRLSPHSPGQASCTYGAELCWPAPIHAEVFGCNKLCDSRTRLRSKGLKPVCRSDTSDVPAFARLAPDCRGALRLWHLQSSSPSVIPALLLQGTQETVVIISSSKKKGNSTAAATTAAAAAEDEKVSDEEQQGSAAASAGGGLGGLAGAAHSWVVGGTGSLGGGVAMAGSTAAAAVAGADVEAHAGDSAAAAAAAEKAEKAEKKKELEEKLEAAAEADVDRIIDSKDNEYVLSKPSE